MSENNNFKVSRERILQLDIAGYYQYLCSIGGLFKEYLEANNINKEIIRKWLDNGGISSGKKPECKPIPNEKKIKDIATYLSFFDKGIETIKNIDYRDLCIRISQNAQLLKIVVERSQEENAENFSRLRFDLAATETAIKEYESCNYYILPHIYNGNPDPRILDGGEVALLGIEIGDLITYRELSTTLTGKTIPPDTQTAVKRLKVLYEYFKEDTTKPELQTNRSKAKILAQILGVSSETIRPHLKNLTFGKL